jgi:hypothetical protein
MIQLNRPQEQVKKTTDLAVSVKKSNIVIPDAADTLEAIEEEETNEAVMSFLDKMMNSLANLAKKEKSSQSSSCGCW